MCKRRGGPYGCKVTTTASFYKVFSLSSSVACHFEVEISVLSSAKTTPSESSQQKRFASEPDVCGVAFSGSPPCRLHAT